MSQEEATALYAAIKSDVRRSIYKWLIVIAALQAIYHFAPVLRDSSDGDSRSGMKVAVDAMTGCHYLRASGGITPRLDREGRHVCE